MRGIEPLAKSHDREQFICGSEPLNLFLRQTARQHAGRGISRTFVLVEGDAAEPAPEDLVLLTVAVVFQSEIPLEERLDAHKEGMCPVRSHFGIVPGQGWSPKLKLPVVEPLVGSESGG